MPSAGPPPAPVLTLPSPGSPRTTSHAHRCSPHTQTAPWAMLWAYTPPTMQPAWGTGTSAAPKEPCSHLGEDFQESRTWSLSQQEGSMGWMSLSTMLLDPLTLWEQAWPEEGQRAMTQRTQRVGQLTAP